tara:strand:- start:74 stop:361 length:288 start_codon:yes stop_codon:yes gene_type:complete
MTMNLQQQSDECGYALEAFGKVLKNNNIEVEGKPNIELIMEYQKEYRKIEVRNREIENEVNFNFIQSEKSEAYKEWENSWIDWVKSKLRFRRNEN